DSSYTPCSTDNGPRLHTYMVIGPGDRVDAAKYPWGWEQPGYNDSNWPNAIKLTTPYPAGTGSDNFWSLAPRSIPLFSEKMQRINTVRRGDIVSGDLLKGDHPVTIPAHQSISVLLDQGFNTVAYPEITLSQGRGSSIKITYAEALYTANNE